MDSTAAGPAWLHAGVVLAGGTVLFLLLLSRAETFDVWVEIARNTRPTPGGPRYPGLAFLSFVFRLSAYLILVAGVVTSAGIAIGMIRTPHVDLRPWWAPDEVAHAPLDANRPPAAIVERGPDADPPSALASGSALPAPGAGATPAGTAHAPPPGK